MNLIDNAVKFTPEGGRIQILASRLPEDSILVQVKDSGPGVPEEYRDKIFEPFSQIPGIRSRRRGSGLGLAFCKLAVEACGGKIWVESEPGKGSVFSITLPNRGV
jgi:signal transduction histidine kinase